MIVRVIHRVVDLGWVALGSTLIWVFHHLAHPASLSCQTPISPGRIWQTVEHSKLKSTQPSPRADMMLWGPIVKQNFWLEKQLEKRLHMPF